MTPFGYSAWLFLKNNPVAQYAAMAAIAAVIFLYWLGRHDAGVRRKQEERARIRAERTQRRLKEESDDLSEDVAEARADAPSVSHSSELPIDQRERLFGDRRGGFTRAH